MGPLTEIDPKTVDTSGGPLLILEDETKVETYNGFDSSVRANATVSSSPGFTFTWSITTIPLVPACSFPAAAKAVPVRAITIAERQCPAEHEI